MANKKTNMDEIVLVVGSKVKDLVKENGCQSSGELVPAVSKLVQAAVTAACDRAKENGRKTVRGYDL